MNEEELWHLFCKKNNVDEDTPYEAWSFGGAANYLASLVMTGIKTATASAYDLYALDEEEEMPKVGDYSVILSSDDEALCVIETTKLDVVPFDEVDSTQAYKEGEGDRSLQYWRNVHEEFFKDEYKEYGLKFTHNAKILCEEFACRFSRYKVSSFTKEDSYEMANWKYDGEYSYYNTPSYEECASLGYSFTNEKINEYYKVTLDDEFLGFIRIINKGDYVILGLGIKPEKCGMHNGNIFMNLAFAKISEIYPGARISIMVKKFNKRAINTYLNAGFEVISETDEDYFMECMSR